MTRLVSAEEARGLMEGATPGPWVANLDDDKRAASRDWRVVDTDVRFVVGADWYERHSAGETETVCGVKIAEADAALLAAAPDLAATVIALSEERVQVLAIVNQYRHRLAYNGWSWLPEGADMARADIERLKADRDHLRATLYREGYAPCSSAACNCGGWHK